MSDNPSKTETEDPAKLPKELQASVDGLIAAWGRQTKQARQREHAASLELERKLRDLKDSLRNESALRERAETELCQAQAAAREGSFQNQLLQQKLRQAEADTQILRQQNERRREDGEALVQLKREMYERHDRYRNDLGAYRQTQAELKETLEKLREEKAFLLKELEKASVGAREVKRELELRHREIDALQEKLAQRQAAAFLPPTPVQAAPPPQLPVLDAIRRLNSDQHEISALERKLESMRAELSRLPVGHPERERRQAALEVLTEDWNQVTDLSQR